MEYTLPANRLFHFLWSFQDNPNRKQVVNFFKRNILLAHFIPDGVNRFRAALYFIFNFQFVQFIYNGLRELLDKFITTCALVSSMLRKVESYAGWSVKRKYKSSSSLLMAFSPTGVPVGRRDKLFRKIL
jgi:hypothetical protein